MQLRVCVSPHQCSLPLFLACSASWRCLVAAAASAAALSFWNSAATAWKQRSKVTIVIHTPRAAKLAEEQRVAMRPQQTYTCWTFVTLVWHVTALFSISMIQQCVEKSLFISKYPFSVHSGLRHSGLTDALSLCRGCMCSRRKGRARRCFLVIYV